jgi:hypothetical protein
LGPVFSKIPVGILIILIEGGRGVRRETDEGDESTLIFQKGRNSQSYHLELARSMDGLVS